MCREVNLMILMGPLKLEIFYDSKVLRCKEGSAETLSPHKGSSPRKELMRFALGYSHGDFPMSFLAIVGPGSSYTHTAPLLVVPFHQQLWAEQAVSFHIYSYLLPAHKSY